MLFQDCDSPMESAYQIIPEFRIYNRYQELERREREKKELAWEKELLNAMNASDPLGQHECTVDDNNKNLHTCRSCPKLNQQNSNPKLNSSKLKKPKSCENESFSPSWDTKTSEMTTPTTCSTTITTAPTTTTTSKSYDSTRIKQIETNKIDTEQNLLGLCVSCSGGRKDNLNKTVEAHRDNSTCDIDKKLQQLDFIDRTPSPQEKKLEFNYKK